MNDEMMNIMKKELIIPKRINRHLLMEIQRFSKF